MTPDEAVVVRQLLGLVVERVHGPGVDDIVKRAEELLSPDPCVVGGVEVRTLTAKQLGIAASDDDSYRSGPTIAPNETPAVCTCTPCTSGGIGHPTIRHCAACCFGTLIEEYDHDCPEPEHRAMAAKQFPPHPAMPKTGSDLADQRRRERETGSGPFGDDPLSTAERMGAADEHSQFAECARCGHQYQNHVGLDGTRCNAGGPCSCLTFAGPGEPRG